MQLLNLLNVPNQSFVTTQDNDRYEIRIILCNQNMCADITKNGQVILSAVRCISGTPLIPFKYLEGSGGNFIFVCSDENCIDYNLFGLSQNLYYLSYNEMTGLGA